MPNSQPGSPETLDIAKAQARRLTSALKDDLPLKHGQALELIARIHGQQSWGHLRASIESAAAPVISARVNPPDLSAAENDRIVFGGMTVEEVQHLAKIHLHWRGYDSYELGCLLNKLDVEYCELSEKNPELRVFPKVTLGDLRRAEYAYRLERPARVAGEKRIAEALDRMFSSDLSPLHVDRDIDLNMRTVMTSYRGFTRHKLDGLPVDITTKGIHAIYAGSDVVGLYRLLPGVVDLTVGKTGQQLAISRILNTPLPEGSFRNPASGLKVMMSLYCEKANNGRIWNKPTNKTPVIVRLTDLLTMPHPDILLAQARACGFFLVVWANRMDVDNMQLQPILQQTNLLIETCSQSGQIVVCSKALQETPELNSRPNLIDRAVNTVLMRH
jgi:hypothetical protein